MNSHITDLCRFLDSSPVNFFAAESVRQRLEQHGFARLDMRDSWSLKPGDRRYVTVNGTAIFAFVAGTGSPAAGFHIIAAHSDSPGFRIKPSCEMPGDGGSVRLNTEVYGGPILYTWFDRPLSLAGRVMLRSSNPLHPHSRLVRIDRPLLVIPHLAIHFNRAVNEGNKLSKQKDMLPVLAIDSECRKGTVRDIIAEALDEAPGDIVDYDLSLYKIGRAHV